MISPATRVSPVSQRVATLQDWYNNPINNATSAIGLESTLDRFNIQHHSMSNPTRHKEIILQSNAVHDQ
jgi:hypothetical protein